MTAPVQLEDTRTRVLGVALELIAERGFASTSTREVCERIGFTKAALYYHFRTKDELLEALVAPVLRGLEEIVATELAPGAAARRGVLVRYVALVTAHADVMRVLYDDPSARNQGAMQPVRALYRRLFELLAGASDASPGEIARARASTGAIHAALLRGDADDDREVLAAAALLAGCGALGVPAPRTTQGLALVSRGTA